MNSPVTGDEWRELPPDLQAVTPVLVCSGCGATQAGVSDPPSTPAEIEPSEHCGDCPPWTCEDCGETCSAAALCSCWVKLDGLPLADIKGLLALADLSVGGAEKP
jgi:hypothetical protein